MAIDAGCMNVAPENIHGWKGDLDPYANFQFNNNTRVPYTSVCSRLDGSTTETLNNRLDMGTRGQATISSVWTVVAPNPNFGQDCVDDLTQCPYLSPGCALNATWDAKEGVLYIMNSTDAGTVSADSKCLYYQNRTFPPGPLSYLSARLPNSNPTNNNDFFFVSHHRTKTNPQSDVFN